MDKTKIKNFAINARKRLRTDVKQTLANYGIDNSGINDELDISTPEVKFYTTEQFPLTGHQIVWRQQIADHLKQSQDEWIDTLDEFIEEVAYTWFNRIIAIRFMEVNDYLPSRTRVLSSEEGRVEPDIISHVWEIEDDLGGYSDDERELIGEALNTQLPAKMDEMYAMLFIKQSDALSAILPGLFEKTNDYLKLLFTPNYNSGVIKDLLNDIPEAYFDVEQEGQVEIIGWFYQYYNTEPHDKVVNINGGVVKKKDIPAATQLFTTDWVVRYMVDNSLGKYYLERHPESNLADSLVYLLPSDIKTVDDNRPVTEYKFIDNAMGSGHILVYAFDVLMLMYEEEGYSRREAVHLILENNLYGLEIDKRAYQLAYFALMMKARQYDRRLFRHGDSVKPQIYQFHDLHDISDEFYQRLDSVTVKALKQTLNPFYDAEELGSIITVDNKTNIDDLISKVLDVEVPDELDLFGLEDTKQQILAALNILKIMSQKYEVVVTNPPYMNKFEQTLKNYLKENYKEYSRDLFSVFIYHNANMLKANGYAAYMTPLVWMFIKSYQELRINIINTKKIDSLIQLEYSAFEEATVPINTFILKNTRNSKIGTYLRLADFTGGMEVQNQKVLEAIRNPKISYLYRTDQFNFKKIPGSPIAYWITKKMFIPYENGITLGSVAKTYSGLVTGNNDKFQRRWQEVDFKNIGFGYSDAVETIESDKKWYPCNSGGMFRKWSINNSLVVNWKNNGYEIRHYKNKNGKLAARPQNVDKYFKEGLTWNKISSSRFAAKYKRGGFIFDDTSRSAFINDKIKLFYLIGLLCSNVATEYLKALNPTMSFTNGDIVRVPYIYDEECQEKVTKLVRNNIKLTDAEWDSFEASWDYKEHPIMSNIADHNRHGTLEEAYNKWEQEAFDRFNQLKANEEELNRIFIDLYGLQDELTPEESDDDVTVRKADRERDIKSFLSYFIGCVFGRYSLDVDGLAYAGGKWDDSKYKTFQPNHDNLILLTDRDYFGDSRDIINRLREFLVVTFGEEHLAENMHFIAETLDSKKVEKRVADDDIIRDYFLTSFFKDHDKVYQKRPIYWEFNSGRNDGFKALMYLHRYDKHELSIVRNYLHQVQAAYDNMLKVSEQSINHAASVREKHQYQKNVAKLKRQLDELHKYDGDLHHQALNEIELDLDDGVLINHAKLQGNKKLLSKI